jgi:hypothetical protein
MNDTEKQKHVREIESTIQRLRREGTVRMSDRNLWQCVYPSRCHFHKFQEILAELDLYRNFVFSHRQSVTFAEK